MRFKNMGMKYIPEIIKEIELIKKNYFFGEFDSKINKDQVINSVRAYNNLDFEKLEENLFKQVKSNSLYKGEAFPCEVLSEYRLLLTLPSKIYLIIGPIIYFTDQNYNVLKKYSF